MVKHEERDREEGEGEERTQGTRSGETYGDEMDTPERSKVAGTPISKFEVICDSRGFFDRFEFHDSLCFGGVLLVFQGGFVGLCSFSVRDCGFLLGLFAFRLVLVSRRKKLYFHSFSVFCFGIG